MVIKPKHITIGLHVLVWSAVLLLPYTFSGPDNSYAHIGFLYCNYFTLANVVHIGLFYFNAFYLYSRFLNAKLWWVYLLGVFISIIVAFQMKMIILKTWFPVLTADEKVFPFTFAPLVAFLIISTVYRLITDKINAERERLAMELKFLRSQVNPHFLFNVLNNLVSMARHKSEKLEPSLIKLSGIMRYMLYDSDAKKIPLQVEFDYLKDYINLQDLRYEGDVLIETAFHFEANSHTIEPMLLIPFVENAFKHGITTHEKPFIKIEVNLVRNVLSFSVVNRFEHGERSTDATSGIGLANVKRRLKILYPKNHHLSIKKMDGLFQVELTLKLE